jgi:hypothetical protein
MTRKQIRMIGMVLVGFWIGALGLWPEYVYAAQPYEIVSYQTTYTHDAGGSRGKVTHKIKYWAPVESYGRHTYPLMIVLPPSCSGTSCNGQLGSSFTNGVAPEAAKRGIIAAIVGYDNFQKWNCGCDGTGSGTYDGISLECQHPNDSYAAKANSIFNRNLANSAISRILAHTANHNSRPDIALGIAVGGHSQGTFVAHLAGRSSYGISSAIKAAYLTGTGVDNYGGPSGDTRTPCPRNISCNASGATGTIPGSKIRAYTGSRDTFFAVEHPQACAVEGANPTSVAGARQQLAKVTGFTSSRDYYYHSSTGAGWRAVTGKSHTGVSSGSTWLEGDESTPENQVPWTLPNVMNWIARRLGALEL